ncbi:hypothetical protein OAJ77_08580 [Rhodospirillales bacterium]|nr:hypothetical protein [Rhodospirillales bacterium]
MPSAWLQGSWWVLSVKRLRDSKAVGHTITAIFDPSADTETGFLSCFAEPQEAVEFLTYKRRR